MNVHGISTIIIILYIDILSIQILCRTIYFRLQDEMKF